MVATQHAVLNRLLWLGFAWAFSDCVASIKLVAPIDCPPEADREDGSSRSSGGSGGGGGSSSSSGGVVAVLVDKASLRFFKFQRGGLVMLK